MVSFVSGVGETRDWFVFLVFQVEEEYGCVCLCVCHALFAERLATVAWKGEVAVPSSAALSWPAASLCSIDGCCCYLAVWGMVDLNGCVCEDESRDDWFVFLLFQVACESRDWYGFLSFQVPYYSRLICLSCVSVGGGVCMCVLVCLPCTFSERLASVALKGEAAVLSCILRFT